MMRQVVMAAALAGGIFLVPALHPSAEAAVVGANAGLDKPSGITMIRRGGGGGGGGGKSFGGGGGKSFGGGGGKSFGGGMGKSYAGGGSRMSHKSFGGHRMGNKNFNGHRSYHKGHAHRHHRHNRFFVTGVPYYGYYYDGYYGYDDDCYWLRRRAIRTGSSYWWNRYYACQGY